ncbi:PREDICTED: NLR family CARD domain-containing protein 4 isoform X2 [Crocodylus porosus]|uniref:NLR family CARD domain-containing protein 4 isoform X2 n=1 Tax=Crocodylus porosus TaxID=8502 RepID=UPI00093E5F4B|nr:PREDICTED: NLR family CARD domain-containing protein 4 isoform X2 [Crocodylus porosus]
MDFIKKNSVHLIQRMGMVTVKQLVDDLFASNVLSGEEMNTIVCEKTQQDASRMMIYMVLNKGSEACRILVKALEKQNPFLYQELYGYCGLIDGIHNLINIEKLIFDNIKMNESDAKKLAEGIKLLKKLHLLHLSHLTDVGDGMRCIVRAISAELGDLEEIHLVNCCLSGDAVEILAQNLCNLPKLNVLDLSENYLGKDGKVAVHKLANSLNILPNMKVLMLPWGDDVNVCLSDLLVQLKTMPQLTKLRLKRWSLTDVEVKVLGTFFEKTPLEDLQHLDLAMNCVTSNGWLSFIQALVNLNKLRFLDFSSKCDLVPDPLLICKMSQVLTTLNYLKEIRLTGWKLDDHDLGLISDAKVSCGKEFQLVNS